MISEKKWILNFKFSNGMTAVYKKRSNSENSVSVFHFSLCMKNNHTESCNVLDKCIHSRLIRVSFTTFGNLCFCVDSQAGSAIVEKLHLVFIGMVHRRMKSKIHIQDLANSYDDLKTKSIQIFVILKNMFDANSKCFPSQQILRSKEHIRKEVVRITYVMDILRIDIVFFLSTNY